MKILVIAAHPDDEILGCGGTIARHVEEGCEVEHAILSTGLKSRGNVNQAQIDKLREASLGAAGELGITDVKHFNFPDNAMDETKLLEIVKCVELLIKEFKPELIYTHYSYDLNIDHELISRAVITATRPTSESTVNEIRFFEIVSSTEWANSLRRDTFRPNLYIDISRTKDKKLKSLSWYEQEMRKYPHPRSYDNIINKAKVRGAESGFMYSEAFEIAFRRIPVI